MQKKKQNKSRNTLFDFLIEALRAEGMTQTGRINLTVTVLLGACLLILLPVKATETLAASILIYFGKEPPELIPLAILYALGFGSILFFIMCLWVVRNMELRKQSAGNKTIK